MNQLLAWTRGVLRALRERDGTALLVRMHAAHGPLAFRGYARDLRANEATRSLTESRLRIDTRTFDIDELRAMPEGSLGRTYVDFMVDNDLVRDVHIPPGPWPESEDTAYARARWRETHDFRHVLCGLGTSLHDETVMAAFQYGMLPNSWSLQVCVVGPWLSWRQGAPWRTMAKLVEAYRAGRRARPLCFAHFEELLEQPVDELREHFDVPWLEHLSVAA